MTEEEENYWIAFELLTDVLAQIAKRGDIPRNHLIAPFADILAALAVKSGGTETLRATIAQLLERLEQAAAGEFPPGG